MEFKHQSVLLEETVRNLRVKPDGIYVDGTLGGGGHSYAVCQQLSAKGSLIGIDQDEAAIKAAGERLKEFGENVTIIRSNYCSMKKELQKIGIPSVDGIILDLGVSSYQLDNKERGFTYREDVPLDMRMDQRNPRTARDIVNTYSEKELYRIIRDYGEDKFAKNIAKHICLARQEKDIETTGELAEIIKHAIPMKMRAVGGHPAKRTFQAIRIELNQELDVLRDSLDDMIDLLNDGGRICIITFHSLEDRIVKTIFRRNENPCTCPPDFPVCVCGKKSKGKVITRKPILPSQEELENNSRSKSAKLRVFERMSKQRQRVRKRESFMASTRNRNKYDNRKRQRYTGYYDDGNAARRLEEVPEQPKKELSRRAKRNRAKSTSISRGYIVFLSLVCALATAACVHYIKLTAQVTAQRSVVASRELELNQLKEDNDAYYSEVITGVDLDEIRDRAINELGMQYATEDQIRYYTPGNNSYVRQYQDVPEN